MTIESNHYADAFARLLLQIEALTGHVPAEVRALIDDANGTPLTPEEADQRLGQILDTLEVRARERGDLELAEHLVNERGAILDAVRSTRTGHASQSDGDTPRVKLQARDGMGVSPVVPPPMLNGREIRVWAGFLPARDIDLWDGNSRLKIHIDQFLEANGRRPSADEVLDIMLTKMELPGVEHRSDQFEIKELARSIAKNKVRVPPIVDQHGTLLDGNRRVAACRYILDSDSGTFGTEAKERAEWVPVWQLDHFADEAEARHVVIALNFEPDPKEPWPKYVKATKVAEEYDRRVRLEPTRDDRRDREIRREVAEYFGVETKDVTQYLKMVDVSQQFEEYHVESRGRDPHKVKHRATKHFEYFDELSKGESKGVAYVLRQNDDLRRLIFDLLYQGKFTRFSQVRHVKHLPESADAVKELREARDLKAVTPELLDDAKHKVDEALTAAGAAAKERRQLDPNTRIENFVTWLKAIPLSTLTEKVEPRNLLALREALEIANKLADHALQHLDGDDEGQ